MQGIHNDNKKYKLCVLLIFNKWNFTITLKTSVPTLIPFLNLFYVQR